MIADVLMDASRSRKVRSQVAVKSSRTVQARVVAPPQGGLERPRRIMMALPVQARPKTWQEALSGFITERG
eukprot:15439114-Alexandrium_andersonii.AAC.1